MSLVNLFSGGLIFRNQLNEYSNHRSDDSKISIEAIREYSGNSPGYFYDIMEDECKSVLSSVGHDFTISKDQFDEIFGRAHGKYKKKNYDILLSKFEDIERSDELDKKLINLISLLQLRSSYKYNEKIFKAMIPDKASLQKLQIYHTIISYNILKKLINDKNQLINDLLSWKKQGPVDYEKLYYVIFKYDRLFYSGYNFINALSILENIQVSATKLENESIFYTQASVSLGNALKEYKSELMQELIFSLPEETNEKTVLNFYFGIRQCVNEFNSAIYHTEQKYKIYLAIYSKHFARSKINLEKAYDGFILSLENILSTRARLSSILETAIKLSPGFTFLYCYIIRNANETLENRKTKVEFLIKEGERLKILYGYSTRN